MEFFYDLAAKVVKHLRMRTVHEYVPRMLLAALLLEFRRQGLPVVEANRRLFEYGAFAGSRTFAEMADAEDARRLVGRATPEDLARAMRVYGRAAWYIFTGARAEVEPRVEGDVVVGRVKPLEDCFFDVEAGELNPYFLAAGSYETATLMFFQLAGVDDWIGMWRPSSEGGLVGFYARRGSDWWGVIESVDPGFFSVVSAEMSDRLAGEYLGLSLL